MRNKNKEVIVLLALVISMPIVLAKEITLTEIINYRVEKVLVEDGTLKLLIYNPSNKYLQFHIVINNQEALITKEIVNPYTSGYILIPSKSNFIEEITITPGFESQDKEDIYLYKSTTRTIKINQEVIPVIEQEQQNQIQTSYLDNTKTYFYGNGLIASNNNNELTYYISDNIGSNTIETNVQGDKINEITYDPYGSVLKGNADDRISFTGKELDSGGLQYFGARYYDHYSGRFTQVDPILRDSESNYHYANNNPLKYVDKDGNVADTFLDAFFVGADLFFIGKDMAENGKPDPTNVAALCLDLTCMITPFITGGGAALRTAEATTATMIKVPEAIRIGQVAEKGAQAALESRKNDGESFKEVVERLKKEKSQSSGSPDPKDLPKKKISEHQLAEIKKAMIESGGSNSKRLGRALSDAGFEIQERATSRGHFRIVEKETGKTVKILSSTPGEYRGAQNSFSQFKNRLKDLNYDIASGD